MIKILLMLSICKLSMGMEVNYREEMKKLIGEIRKGTTQERIIVTQNGTDLYYKKGELDRDFLSVVDGAAQESLLYGHERYNGETPPEFRRAIAENLLDIGEGGRSVFLVNYTDKKRYVKRALEFQRENNFIGAAPKGYDANTLHEPMEVFTGDNIDSLREAKNFLYLLNPEKFKNHRDYGRILASTNYDLLIIDPFYEGKILTRKQVEKLKKKKNGGRRIVLAYFSIGEAEVYRYYWKDEWREKLPSWIAQENKRWKGNYIVRYWERPWKEILTDYQQRLDDSGFDGYYLDTIDSYFYFEEGRGKYAE